MHASGGTLGDIKNALVISTLETEWNYGLFKLR